MKIFNKYFCNCRVLMKINNIRGGTITNTYGVVVFLATMVITNQNYGIGFKGSDSGSL